MIENEPTFFSLVNSAIHKITITKDNSLKRATEFFLEKKKGLLSEGTLKEYKTIFKSLFEYEQYTKKPLAFTDFNQSFFNNYEKYLISKKNPYAKEVKLRQLENDQYKNVWEYMYKQESKPGKKKIDIDW